MSNQTSSTYFDDSIIRQILQSVNIVEVIGNYLSLQRHGKEMVGLCPFHDDSKPSLNVSESKQIFKCFACGAGGDVFKFIMLREQMAFPEAVRFLADRAGIRLAEKRSQGQPGVDRHQLEQLNRWAADWYQSQYEQGTTGKKARDYVQERGISAETAGRFQLGWAGPGWDGLCQAAGQQGKSIPDLLTLGLVIRKEQGGYYDRFRERLIFPVYDALGRCIAFGGRTLVGDAAKYINSPETPLFQKSRTLYGLNLAKDSILKGRRAVVVEGYTDCIMAHQCGVDYAVATLGTALTADHARILSRYADRIILVFDSDEAGEKAADRAVEVFLSQRVELSLVNLPGGKDPCDFLCESNGREAFEELIEQASDGVEYKWQKMEKQLTQADSIGGHVRAVELFLDYMSKSLNLSGIDEIGRGYVCNRIAKLLNLSGSQVQQRMSQRQRRFAPPRQTGTKTRPTSVEAIESHPLYKAQKAVLEILLNRPDLFGQVRPVLPEADAFIGSEHQQIAGRIWHVLADTENPSLGEITAGCESVELCGEILNLAETGSRRGNFEQTLADALGKIQGIQQERSREELREMLSQAEGKYGSQAQQVLIRDYQARWRPDPRRSGLFRQG